MTPKRSSKAVCVRTADWHGMKSWSSNKMYCDQNETTVVCDGCGLAVCPTCDMGVDGEHWCWSCTGRCERCNKTYHEYEARQNHRCAECSIGRCRECGDPTTEFCPVCNNFVCKAHLEPDGGCSDCHERCIECNEPIMLGQRSYRGRCESCARDKYGD